MTHVHSICAHAFTTHMCVRVHAYTQHPLSLPSPLSLYDSLPLAADLEEELEAGGVGGRGREPGRHVLVRARHDLLV